MTITAKNIGRINVWPTYDTAREADTEESKFVGQLTVWRTNEEAQANISHEEEGGGGAPAWVPANAKIHIDFLGGTPQGRAWVQGTGEVGISTLLGEDPDAIGTGLGQGTEFNPDNMSPEEGLRNHGNLAFIGVAKSLVMSSFTCRIQWLWPAETSVDSPQYPFTIASLDGANALAYDFNWSIPRVRFSGFVEINLSLFSPPLNSGTVSDAYNATAFTLTDVPNGGRLEFAINGSAVTGGIYDTDDRPSGNPFTGAIVTLISQALQSITLYDPLPDTTGLSDLSEV